MTDGPPKVCGRCGREYASELSNMGRWECRIHRLPMELSTTRYPCCGVKDTADPTVGIVDYTAADFQGCHAADHELPEPPHREWPPVAMMTYHGLDLLPPMVASRLEREPGGGLVILASRRSYQEYARDHPSFGTDMVNAALADEATFKSRILAPLLSAALLDPVFYTHMARPWAGNRPTTPFNRVPIRELLLNNLRTAVVAAGADQQRIEFNVRQPPVLLDTLITDVIPIVGGGTFWSRMQQIVAVMNAMGGDVRDKILAHWTTALLRNPNWPEIPVVGVLRASPMQDGLTVARAHSIDRAEELVARHSSMQ